MHIVHLVENLPRGGMEILVATLARGLRTLGHEVSIVCLTGGGEIADELADENFSVTILDMKRVRLGALLSLRRTLRSLRPDCVHCHGLPSGTFGRLALLRTPFPTLVHIHTQVSIAHKLPSRMARRERWLARIPGAIIAISESVREDMVSSTGLSPEQIQILSGGVPDRPHPDRARSRKQYGLADTDFAVISLSSLTPHKQINVLIDAVASFSDCVLLVAGKGPSCTELKKLAEYRGIGDRIRFLGQVQDVPGLLSAGDVFSLASWPREGLSLAVIEALRAGLPAVVSRVGGLPEVVEHRWNGFVVPPCQPDEFAKAFSYLRNNPAETLKMGERSRRRFIERYELSLYLKKLEDIYRQI